MPSPPAHVWVTPTQTSIHTRDESPPPNTHANSIRCHEGTVNTHVSRGCRTIPTHISTDRSGCGHRCTTRTPAPTPVLHTRGPHNNYLRPPNGLAAPTRACDRNASTTGHHTKCASTPLHGEQGCSPARCTEVRASTLERHTDPPAPPNKKHRIRRRAHSQHCLHQEALRGALRGRLRSRARAEHARPEAAKVAADLLVNVLEGVTQRVPLLAVEFVVARAAYVAARLDALPRDELVERGHW